MTPHDAFAKSVFQELPHARGLLRGYLPPRIEKEFDWKTLRLERDSFRTDELEGEFADLLFSIRFRDLNIRQRVRWLFEHKREYRKGTPRQVHGYISRQFEQTPLGQPLPAVITVLLLQSGQCRQPKLSAEYQLPDHVLQLLSPYLPDFSLVSIELSQLRESELRGTEVGRLALAILKTAGEGRPMRWLEFRGVLRDLCSHLPPEQVNRELHRALYYLTSITEPEDEPEIRESLLQVKAEFEPVKETVMTLLEHLEQRGQRRGRVISVLEMLRAANPELTDADAARLEHVPDQTLDALIHAVVQRRPWPEIRKLLRGAPRRSVETKSSKV